MDKLVIPDPTTAIAIVGMAGRFPRAANIAEFWRNLYDGQECVTFFSDDELEHALIDPEERQAAHYVRAKAILKDIDRFDAAFFDFSPREAALTDPQHRLFLECAWEALENAGYVPDEFPGAIGVFAGAGANAYLMYNLAANGYLQGSIKTFQAFIHNKNDHLATRVAYKLNLHGPAVNVQTACSTSLVAVHLACQSLLTYQSDMCLAGGVTISHPQNAGYLYHEQGIGSPDGHCRPFDAAAQGTVAGSGAGIVVLKRYMDALEAGDHIYAVILGSAINNDGHIKVGYTAPSVDYQAQVIETAIALSGITADTISYVEAHGTATPMGDPIEVAALSRAFEAAGSGDQKQFCALGGVKGNVGHLDTAAGVAGLIKTSLSLERQTLLPSLHFQQPNPLIRFAETPFFVNAERRAWNTPADTPRRAGVSAFGLGGTNAHVVLQEAPPRPPSDTGLPWKLLLLSAQSETALERATANLTAYLQQNPQVNLADVAYTLQVGRKAFTHRRMVAVQSAADAIDMLRTLAPDRVFSHVQEPEQRRVTFMFPGQGAQHIQMGRELYENASMSVFRQVVDECLALLRPLLDVDLGALLYPSPEAEEWASEALLQTQYAQPALFVIEYALARLWQSWGLQPQAMVGHSIGEYVAACLAGVMSLPDALKLVALRGRLIQSLSPGSMLSVPLAEAAVQPYLKDGLDLAAINGPALCVLSGPVARIDALEAALSAEKIICRRLHTSHAFHSRATESILDAFRAAVGQITLRPPQIPYLSNVTGGWITSDDATDPDYYARHIRQTVRFADNLTELLRDPDAVLLEVGPGRTLRTIARWHPDKQPNQFMYATLPHPQEPHPSLRFLLNTIGQLWLAGVSVDWAALYARECRHRLPLPTYPFERQRCWVDLPHVRGGISETIYQDLLRKKTDVADWFYLPLWQEAPLSPRSGQSSAEKVNWLFFLQRDAFAAAWERHLSRQLPASVQPIFVRPGSAFRALSHTEYEIRPRHAPDYDALLAALATQAAMPHTIWHGWSVSDEALSDQETLQRGLHSLTYLAQAIGRRQSDNPIQLLIISNHMQEVVGGDLRYPEKATLVGPCLVIPREYKQVRCRSIDIDWPLTTPWQEERLLAHLLREPDQMDAGIFTAYRHGRRWVKHYQPQSLTTRRASLKADGIYLITGGLGGLGLTFAHQFARQKPVRLVLTGRSAFPPRARWPAWLAEHDSTNPTVRQIRQLQEIEAQGSQVWIAQADVTNEAEMRQLLRDVQAAWGSPVQGVIHAAGVPAGGLIQLKTTDVIENVLAAKMQGTRALYKALQGQPLDFFVLCSSLTSIIGRLGQVDYTAANAFMDAFARYQHAQTGQFITSINWGAWDEVGMAVPPGQRPTPGASAVNGAASPQPSARPINHPLLERCLQETDAWQLFATDYSVDKHWVLDGHRILGHPVIPGVAYFEMVRAALDVHPRDYFVEFREALFLAPLRVRDREVREVRLLLEKREGEYAFSIRGDEAGKGAASSSERVFTAGRVRLRPAGPLRKYDIAAIRRKCNVRELILPAEEREEDLGPRWHSVQRVHLGVNEVLIELHMPDAFHRDFEEMVFHPALLDRAAGIAKNFLAHDDHYLPLTYNSLTIKAPLKPKIYSYARFRVEDSPDKETITFDIVLMDEEGYGLVEIERFTQKRVNDPGAEIRALADVALADAAPVDPSPDDDNARREISPAEGADALGRILGHAVAPRVIVSVRDLVASIKYTDEVVQDRLQEARQIGGTAVAPGGPRPNLNTPFVAPHSELEQNIAVVWREMLGIEEIGVNDNFFELGGDSLIGMELVSRLSKQLNTHIPAVNLFEGPTISALSRLISPDTAADTTLDDSESRGARRRERQAERRTRRERSR